MRALDRGVPQDSVIATPRLPVLALHVAVYIGTATDPEHFDDELLVVDSVDHSVVPDVSAMESCEFVLQRIADPARISEQAPIDEFDDGPRGRRRDCLGQRPGRRSCYDWLVPFVGLVWLIRLTGLRACHRRGRNARTAAIPRTASPRAIASRAAAISVTASGSRRISRVSTSPSRSSLATANGNMALRVSGSTAGICSRCWVLAPDMYICVMTGSCPEPRATRPGSQRRTGPPLSDRKSTRLNSSH